MYMEMNDYRRRRDGARIFKINPNLTAVLTRLRPDRPGS